MNKVIPILPCLNVSEQAEFFKSLGFEILVIIKSPNPYLAIKYDSLELHFYSSKRMNPKENPSMCYVSVDNVDSIYEAFTTSYKLNTGRVPRAGLPRFTKLRDLKDDRRFTMTDISGNTYYIGTAHSKENQEELTFFRTIASEEYAYNYELLYDFLYSKESPEIAANMLEKFFQVDIEDMKLSEIDQAKFLILVIDMELQLKKKLNNVLVEKLNNLMQKNDSTNSWKKIEKKIAYIIDK